MAEKPRFQRGMVFAKNLGFGVSFEYRDNNIINYFLVLCHLNIRMTGSELSSSMAFSVITVSKCFLSVGFGRFCRKNLGFRFGFGFHDKRVVNFFMTRVIWHDFHHR